MQLGTGMTIYYEIRGFFRPTNKKLNLATVGRLRGKKSLKQSRIQLYRSKGSMAPKQNKKVVEQPVIMDSPSDREETLVVDSDSDREKKVAKAVKAKPVKEQKPKKAEPKKVEPEHTSDSEAEAEPEAQADDEPKTTKKRVVNGCVPVDLVKQVMKQSDFPEGAINQAKVKTILDMFIKTIVENVKNGDNVTLTNYMTFKRTQRAERTHKIPKTDNTVTKPAHMVMTIDVKPALKKEFEALPVSE